jgi:hypothetical protein
MPHRKEPTAIAIQFTRAIVEMPGRLHLIDSSIGSPGTARENRVPQAHGHDDRGRPHDGPSVERARMTHGEPR